MMLHLNILVSTSRTSKPVLHLAGFAEGVEEDLLFVSMKYTSSFQLGRLGLNPCKATQPSNSGIPFFVSGW